VLTIYCDMLFALFLSLLVSFVFSQETICTKYSQALKITNKQLVSTVVNGVVPKVVAPGTPTKRYFDGTVPRGSLNYTSPANSGALTSLVDSLVKFFGGALGCKDGTIGAYTGPTMDKVHLPLGITDGAFNFFNQRVIEVMRGAGVVQADLTAVLSVLNSLRGQIVKQVSICDKYSVALKVDNKKLVTNVVTGTFGELTKPNAPTLPFFNGQTPAGSTNYVAGGAPLNALVDGLVSFFGGALGCTDGTIKPYKGPSLKQAHANMGVTRPVFNFFNLQVLKVMRGAGVTAGDLNAVARVLNSTAGDIITK